MHDQHTLTVHVLAMTPQQLFEADQQLIGEMTEAVLAVQAPQPPCWPEKRRRPWCDAD